MSWKIKKGVGCGRQESPGVYSRVSGQIDWINDQVCKLSGNPPRRCGGSSIPTSLTRFRVDIQHDVNSREIGWSIQAAGSDEILAGSRPATVRSQQVLVSTYVDLPNGAYEFVITDSYGDGLDFGAVGGTWSVNLWLLVLQTFVAYTEFCS